MVLNRIYNEDYLETFKRLNDNCVDLVIADPLYKYKKLLSL